MTLRIRTLILVCSFFLNTLASCKGREDDSGTNAGGGFVALRSSEVNMRAGPGKDFPIIYVYRLKHMPLRVTGEYDKWLRVMDMDGDMGWISEGLSIKLRTVLTLNDSQFLYHSFHSASYPTHMVEKNVVGKLLKCRQQRCRVRIGKIKGWLNRSDIWGPTG
jgi:SH3-like domain-containing protein